ncbi:MAG TPA: hypothetical protein VJ984_07675 [Xanthomonadales bacterium]|nr:hypothetical protein [Xanthomonadales bacterium]
MKKLIPIILLLIPAYAAASGDDNDFFSGVDALPPEQRFRQLSLMLMVSDGANEALISTLSSQLDVAGPDNVDQDPAAFDFDDYTTPLIRIVDQRTMLLGATRLFRFTREHATGIAERLRQLQEENKKSDTPFPGYAISEDAIIIRNAIADSIDYTVSNNSGESEVPQGGQLSLASDYRARTTFLRNNLEYELFAADLERITADAVADVGGRTAAYERMFDDEVDGEAINKKIRAAEYAYGWDRDFDERAAEMAEKMLEIIAIDESVPDL